MNKRLLVYLAALVMTLVSTPALACIHAMAKSKSTPVAPTDLEAIVAWDDGVEDLVVRLGYQSGEDGPEKLAYVLPVRNVPSHYAVVEEAAFDELREFVDLKRVYRPKTKSRSIGLRATASASAESSALQEMPAVTVGPFEIQPLKATGAAGLRELQAWMKENGFSPIPSEDAKYYVDRNWTFLAVKLAPEGDDASTGTIPALHVRFATERAVLPLKLLKMNQPISVTAYLLTRDAVPRETREAVADKHQFESTAGRYDYVRAPATERGQLESRHASLPFDRAPTAVQKLLKELGWPTKSEPSLLVLYSGMFGSDRVDPASWAEEMAIPPADDKLMGADAEKAAAVPPKSPDSDEGGPATNTNVDAAETDDEPLDANPSVLTNCSVSGTSGPSALLLLIAVVFGWRTRRR